MTRVLVGDFAALHRLGLEDILGTRGLQVLATEGSDLVHELVAALPDVVVLDLDKPDAAEQIREITGRFPAVRVVACSSARPRMQVYPARHYGEFYTSALDPERLAAAVGD